MNSENDSNTIRVDGFIFENGEKVFKMSIFESIRICEDEALV